jgi:tRNA threonylcarbamoyladenosine modification (KEOPS) complex  Pcc1 subunit
MKYSLQLKVDYKEEIMALFDSFNESYDRASVSIKKNKDKIIFDIKASDSVALRSMLNSITKLFTVYEKLNKVLGDENE